MTEMEVLLDVDFVMKVGKVCKDGFAVREPLRQHRSGAVFRDGRSGPRPAIALREALLQPFD
jgi:hypothetical protein